VPNPTRLATRILEAWWGPVQGFSCKRPALLGTSDTVQNMQVTATMTTETDTRNTDKKSYHTPTLTVFGSIARTTQNNGPDTINDTPGSSMGYMIPPGQGS
jgi:hypothetical protein